MYTSKISFLKNTISKNSLYNKSNVAFSSLMLDYTQTNSVKEANTKNKKDNKTKWFKVGGLGALLTSAAAILAGIFKSKNKPNSAFKSVKKMIKLLKPEDVDTAKEFYPVLLKNKDALNLKQELVNPIMKSINKENMPFMISEGVDLIASKMHLIKDCIVSQAEDIPLLFKSLTSKNKNIFNFVVDNMKNLRVDAIEDIEEFLKINVDKQEYILKNILPKLMKYDKELDLKASYRFSSLADKITPECEHLIQQVAEFKLPEGVNINKYSVLRMVNNENKDCVIPLLKSLENSKYNTSQLQKILSEATGKNTKGIIAVSKHADTLTKLKIDYNEVKDMIKDEDTAKVFDFIMNKHKFFQISDSMDIDYCLKYIKAENLKFISEELINLLQENNKLLGVNEGTYMIVHAVKNADSSALNVINSVIQSAKDLASIKGLYLDYAGLISALNKDNIHKLPKLTEKFKQPEFNNATIVQTDDFIKLLDEII